MKIVKTNRVDFSEIFHYAEKEFSIGWNACNDLFFRHEVLTYKSVDDVYFDSVLESFYPDDITKEEFINLTKEQILDFEEVKKARSIIGKFMLDNDIEEIEIDSR